MRIPKRWQLMPPDRDRAERLGRALNISPVVAQLLINRGLDDALGARQFLDAPLTGLHDPDLLPGATAAAERLMAAIRDGKRIRVYGDYDVDGMTGTTLLWRALQLAGAANSHVYTPHRLEEGYGLNIEALRAIRREGYEVVVTVDCGITSLAEAEEARRLGLELIITDHHEMKETLPAADVLVHPRLPGSRYPFPDLCGAGVAFKVAWALFRHVSQARTVGERFKQFLLECLSLVALGTVADVVPLVDENRVFVKHGLKTLEKSPSVGLRALLEVSGLHEKDALDAGHIGFTLAPRLNAAGRLGQGLLGVELLASTVPQRAQELARYLHEQNEVRQKIENRILREAREQVEAGIDLEAAPALVLSSDDWHPGVIGIVASRLTDRYARPVLLISSKDDPAQGSGRSVPGLHLCEVLATCSEHLQAHGGHAAAAGFRISGENIDSFREQFCSEVARRLNGQARQHTLMVDTEVPLSAVTLGLVDAIDALNPYGAGNRRPLLLAGGLQVVGTPRIVGQGERHLNFRVRQESGPTLKAIAFNMADRAEELMSQGGQCSLVFVPKRNEWQGWVNVDLEVSDLQAGPVAQLSG